MTPTQFTAAALEVLPFPPPTPVNEAHPYCWLCGGEAGLMPWKRADAISSTFASLSVAKCPDSPVACQSCAALTRGETWRGVIERRKMTTKTWGTVNWHSYSHFVCDDGSYECPVPKRIREILISPPDQKWLLGVNTTGMKHTIYRSRVNSGGPSWAVAFDETLIISSKDDFSACLAAFERLTALGFSKDDIRSGRYSPAATMRAGLAAWQEAEASMRPWRNDRPDLMDLAHYCALSASALGFDFTAKNKPLPGANPAPAPAQGSLF